MKSVHFLPRLANACGSALLGAFFGLLLSAFGSLVSETGMGVASTIVLATVLGIWMGRFPGAICGTIVGILIAAFGSLIGGTLTGATLFVLACALLSAWINWTNGRNRNRECDATAAPRRPEASNRMPGINYHNRIKEYVR